MKSSSKDVLEIRKREIFSQAFGGLFDQWRAQRRQAGLSATQSDLAALLDTHRNSISNWLAGKSYPSVETMRKIYLLFNVAEDYFDPLAAREKVDFTKVTEENIESRFVFRDHQAAKQPSREFISLVLKNKALRDAVREYENASGDGFLPKEKQVKDLSDRAKTVLADIEREAVQYTAYLIWRAANGM